MGEQNRDRKKKTVLFVGASGIRFEALLVAFAFYFLYSAFDLGIDTEGSLGIAINLAMLSGLLSTAALAVSARRGTRHALLAFLLLVIAMLVLSRTGTRTTNMFDIASHVLMASFVGWVSILIIRGVWSLKQADTEAIAAALCAFLLLGLFWTMIYSLISYIDPGAFGDHNLRLGDKQPLTSLYFSYVTLTTLGYGDINPVSSAARVFAIGEAVVGQVFLVVLVARLVGMSISAPRSYEED